MSCRVRVSRSISIAFRLLKSSWDGQTGCGITECRPVTPVGGEARSGTTARRAASSRTRSRWGASAPARAANNGSVLEVAAKPGAAGIVQRGALGRQHLFPVGRGRRLRVYSRDLQVRVGRAREDVIEACRWISGRQVHLLAALGQSHGDRGRDRRLADPALAHAQDQAVIRRDQLVHQSVHARKRSRHGRQDGRRARPRCGLGQQVL